MNTDLSVKLMDRLFRFITEDITKNYDIYFINLSSLLSTMFYPTLADEIQDLEAKQKYVNNIQTVIKSRILEVYSMDRMFYFYFSSEKSINKTLYKHWDDNLNDVKFDPSINLLFTMFTESIRRFGKEFRNIKVIDTKFIEPCVIPYLYSKKFTINNALIISRDMMDMLSVPKGYHYTDGNILMKSTDRHVSNKIMCVPPELFKYYLFLIPNARHSYKSPIPRGGKTTALKFIVKHFKDGEADSEIFKMNSFKMFDLDEYIKHFKINFSF